MSAPATPVSNEQEIKQLRVSIIALWVVTLIITGVITVMLWSVQKGLWEAVNSLHQPYKIRLVKSVKPNHYIYGHCTNHGLVGDQCIAN